MEFDCIGFLSIAFLFYFHFRIVKLVLKYYRSFPSGYYRTTSHLSGLNSIDQFDSYRSCLCKSPGGFQDLMENLLSKKLKMIF